MPFLHDFGLSPIKVKYVSCPHPTPDFGLSHVVCFSQETEAEMSMCQLQAKNKALCGISACPWELLPAVEGHAQASPPVKGG